MAKPLPSDQASPRAPGPGALAPESVPVQNLPTHETPASTLSGTASVPLPDAAHDAVLRPVLSAAGLHKRYGGAAWAVENCSLELSAGELLCVVGPSGCGKTTLLRLIGGFETPERGEVLQDGRVISRPGWVLPPERRQIGMVFQEPTLFPHLSVRENVQFGLTPSLAERLRRAVRGTTQDGGRPGAEPTAADDGRAELRRLRRGLVELIELCGLGELAERYPHELSGGQQQRVALARALATRPRLLLLDEPFSSLDTHLRRQLREDVSAVLRKAGTTALLVTHDQEEALNMGHRIAVMREGRLEQIATPREILERPANRFVAQFVGQGAFIPGDVKDGRVHTVFGTYPAPQTTPAGASHVRADGPVDVLLRPGELTPAGGPQHGVEVRVTAVYRTAGQPLHTVALPSGHTVAALLGEHPPIVPGDTVRLQFRPDPLVLFRRG